MDKFLFFCLDNKDKRFLAQYLSPAGESTIFKGIPVEHKDRVRDLCLKLGMRCRVVYRGPRRNQLIPSYTRSEDATHFSIYAI